MRDAARHESTDGLQELARVTAAQLDAARSGDLEELRRLLASRRDLLTGLRGGSIPRQTREALAGTDAEAQRLLEAQRAQVQGEMAECGRGRRALKGYIMPLGRASGFVDRLR